MKVTLAQKLLTKRIQGIAAVVPTKTSLPILSTVLMEAEEGKVHLTANDLDVSLTTAIECDVKEEGKVAVPGKKFFEIVRTLEDDEITLSTKGEKLGIHCSKSRFNMVGKSADEFPKLPEQKALATFSIKKDILGEMIAKSIYAVSNDLTRPALCGVLWEIKDGNLIMVATDGHRLSKVEHKGDFADVGGRDFIVSPKSLTILRSLMEEKEEVKISLAENHITFDLDDSVIYSRLLEGPFPDYGQVIPKNNKKELVVNRDAFANACRRVSILASVITHQIKLSIQDDKLGLSVNTPDVGEASEDISCTFDSEPMELGYNAKYLLDILKTMDTEDVRFLLDRSDNAGMLLPVGGDDELKYQCLLMPLRLSD